MATARRWARCGRAPPYNSGGRARACGKFTVPLSLEKALVASDGRGADLIALNNALKSLAEIDERKSKIVELRFFGGLSNKEISEVLSVAEITVIREWNKAKAWLYRELSKSDW